jgi:hypothetical protein
MKRSTRHHETARSLNTYLINSGTTQKVAIAFAKGFQNNDNSKCTLAIILILCLKNGCRDSQGFIRKKQTGCILQLTAFAKKTRWIRTAKGMPKLKQDLFNLDDENYFNWKSAEWRFTVAQKLNLRRKLTNTMTKSQPTR